MPNGPIPFPLIVKYRDTSGESTRTQCDSVESALEKLRYFRQVGFETWIEDVYGRKVDESTLDA